LIVALYEQKIKISPTIFQYITLIEGYTKR
jgi:hypothetical protein